MKKLIVVHSGGMDSSICLAKAVNELGKDSVLALSFSYGQRHEEPELERAKLICEKFDVDRVQIQISSLARLTNNALLDHNREISYKDKLPNTLVVGRNGLMARLAAVHADSLGASAISMGIIGVEAANSGYRDCTREYMDKMEEILRLDLANNEFKIYSPLVHMTKYETMKLANKLGVLNYLLEHSISCYEGIEKQGCMRCPACILRNEGIKAYSAANKDFSISYLERLE